MNRILIVDDDSELRKTLKTALEDVYEVFEAGDGKEALEFLQSQSVNLVLLDMDMPRMGGMESLVAIKKMDPRIAVIILTAYSTVPDAVSAIREGAYNYVAKPVRHEDLLHMIRKALEATEMVAEVVYSAPLLHEDYGTQLSSKSGGMKKIFALIEKLARVDTVVLLRGDSGTGKELVAQAIHANSLHKEGRFVAVNCSAIPETLIESELFGHEKGAFTGADQRKIGKFQFAAGGTIFLDEIGDVSPAMQVKLLRVLQERRFTPVGSNQELETNARIIAATNRNLEERMRKGEFRDDLFYRLNVLPIFLPPLRQRKEDIELLISHYIRKFNQLHQKKIQGIDAPALTRFKEYSWPGNIRELSNVVEHAFVLENSSVITELSLPEHIRPVESSIETVVEIAAGASQEDPSADSSNFAHELDFRVVKEKFERDFIVRALQKFHGKINQTSAQTNMPKKTLLRKIGKYKIKTEDFRK